MVEKSELIDNCGSEIYSFICKHFEIKSKEITTRTVRQLITQVKHIELKFAVYIPWYYYINPLWILNISGFNKKDRILKLMKENDGLLVHCATCKQLYDIDDYWLHFTCEVIKSGNSIKSIDPYRKKIFSDYPDVKTASIDYNSLFEKGHIMIYLYR